MDHNAGKNRRIRERMCFFVPAKVKHFFRGNLAELIVLSVFELAKSLLKNIGYSKIAEIHF
jgi:hypothetical protein